MMNNTEWLKAEVARLELAVQRQKERAEKAEQALGSFAQAAAAALARQEIRNGQP